MANEENAAVDQNMSEKAELPFSIQRVYVKDLSFESPDPLKVFSQSWQPDMHLDMNTKATKLEGDANAFEVVLTLTLTVKNDDAVAFLAEVHQAGIFVVEEGDTSQMSRFLGCRCPEALFPYARECVSNAVSKGGYPQLLLSPVDFNQLFEEALAKQGATQPAEGEKAH